MGESFLGLPNRFRIINNLLEYTYNPNHALSASMGYVLNEKFNSYLPLSGGTITGEITSQNIIPSKESTFSIGSEDFPYTDVYGNTIHGNLEGNSNSTSKLQNQITVTLTGSVTGEVSTDLSGNVIIETSTNHNHDVDYLKLTGGELKGNLALGKDTAIVGYTGHQLLTLSENEKLMIGYGHYLAGIGNTEIYSDGDLSVVSGSSGITIKSDLFDKTINIGTSDEDVFIENTVNGDFLRITDNGKLLFNENDVYHHGNFRPEDLLTTEFSDHMKEVKKVIKVMAILLDELEVYTGKKASRDYPESSITDQLEYYKNNAIEILDK